MSCKTCGGKTHIVQSWKMGGGRNRIKQIVKINECEDCGTRKRSYHKDEEKIDGGESKNVE